MAKLREVKTKEELVLLRKAISITCDAQNELMKVLKPDMKEFQAEAVVEAVFKLNGAEYPGYPSIVGAAENSCILHYTTNRKTMKNNIETMNELKTLPSQSRSMRLVQRKLVKCGSKNL